MPHAHGQVQRTKTRKRKAELESPKRPTDKPQSPPHRKTVSRTHKRSKSISHASECVCSTASQSPPKKMRIEISLIPPDSFHSRFYFPGCSVEGRASFSGVRINTLYTALARSERLFFKKRAKVRKSGVCRRNIDWVCCCCCWRAITSPAKSLYLP